MKRLLMQRKALVAAAALVALAIVFSGGAGAGAGPPDENGVDRAIAAQEGHTPALLAIQGVVGTAVGLGPNGSPAVLIFTESAGIAGLPRSLDGVQVVVKVTGKIFALGHCPEHTRGKPPPGCGNGGGNTAPVADDQSATTPEDTNVVITLTGSDGDGCDTTSFSFSATSPTGGSLSATSGPMTCSDPDGTGALAADVTYDPDPTTTSDSFTFTISDGTDMSSTATVSITVGDAGADCITTGDTTVVCNEPVPIGVSSGNVESIQSSFIFISCNTGTYGARVKGSGNTVYALSNNHIYALENAATTGSNIVQPGPADTGCDASSSNVTGTLFDFVPLVFAATDCDPDNLPDSDCNEVDAAIALSSIGDIGNTTPSDGYGTPKSAIVSAALGQDVQKYGRTTHLTQGTIVAINATLDIGYGSGTARFVHQIVVESNRGSKFLKGGDSGAIVVTDPGKNPVGLAFAGTRSNKFAFLNPIDLVLTAFNVTVDGE